VRRDALLGGIRQHLPQCTVALVPAGGLNLWVRLPDGTDVATLVRAAAARDVLIAHGREWFPAETPGPYVRLNYAGPSPERYDEAMRLVAEALAEQG
ncbi:MAG: PLP-dependent aminotransferase family protein, partial [Microbacterium aurantiacum]